MNLTEKELIESFTDFINENYYVDQLTEENVLWIYEEEFIPSLKESLNEEIIKLQEKMNAMDILGGAATGAATAAVVGFNPIAGAILGGISGAMADYPDAKKAGVKKADAKKVQVASVPKNKTSTNTPKTTTEEKETSPKMQAYLDKMSKNGVRKMSSDDDSKMDKVGEEDSDVDNDGVMDKNDSYLLNRRLKIAKAKLADEDTSKSEKMKLVKQIKQIESSLSTLKKK